MYWWMKDVFVERQSNAISGHRERINKAKNSTAPSVWTQLKKATAYQVERYQHKAKLKRSQQRLNQLDDYHLTDIGLTREDLYWMTQGENPQRFKDDVLAEKQSVALELVASVEKVDNSQTVQAYFNPKCFDKAA